MPAAPTENLSALPSPKHNQEGPNRCQEPRRVFVRALDGQYSDLMRELLEQPRIISLTNMAWRGGPNVYGKRPISPSVAAKLTQALECHINVLAPGACSARHGHMNSACIYILKGRGHDVHDGRRLEWKAGDIVIVENGCVHVHINDDPDNEAILFIFKAKPLFLFMHLLFQKIISPSHNRLSGSHKIWIPPTDL